MEVETIKQMRVDINSALKDVAKQYNADITTANIYFLTQGMIATILRFRTPEMADFESFATVYGITKKLGDKVIANGKVFTVAGLKTGSPKYPVLATSNGKTYKFTINSINRMECIK